MSDLLHVVEVKRLEPTTFGQQKVQVTAKAIGAHGTGVRQIEFIEAYKFQSKVGDVIEVSISTDVEEETAP